MLPSISNLLTNNHDPPALNLSPASPILLPSTPPHSDKSPRYLSIISPILSPIDSPHSLPPLQGDDPPQRLRLPSPSPQPTSPISPKHMLNKWPFPSASSSTSSSTASSASILSASPPLPSISAPPLQSFRHRTLSEDLYTHHHHPYSHQHHERFTQSASPSPPPLHHELQVPKQRQRSVSASHEIPSTQIVFDASGQPVLKRRRGRPPTRDSNNFDGGWTFLAPTVWDVHVSEEQKEREVQADQRINNAPVHLPNTNNEHLMNDAMNAFTNSNMDTILHMPRKKRGRKPKTHIAGNSCFVWKDLTSTRSPNNASATAAPKK